MNTGVSLPHLAVDRILSRSTPVLPLEEVQESIGPHFERRGRYLQWAATRKPPLYLLDKPALLSRAGRLRRAFENVLENVGFYYAVKSNNHPAVAAALVGTGFGLDVSSGLELETALELGTGDIVFSGPGKGQAELELAVRHSHRVVVLMDSWGELHRLETIAGTMGRSIRCGVRLCVDNRGLWRKFGIPLEELPEFWRAADRCTEVQLVGLQFHTSWNLTPDAQTAFIARLGDALATMERKHTRRLEFIDIGGGFWPDLGEWLHPAATPAGRLYAALELGPRPPAPHHRLPADPIEIFAARLAEAIEQHLFPVRPCRICVEPGRWLSHDAMHLLISVVDKKAPDLVITDAGTNTVGWERFESDYFPVLNLSRPSLDERRCDILGSLCTPHDVWGYFYFGTGIEPGDILLIPSQGAYTYSLRQNFIKPLPEVVILED